jgi:hypothetical protein
MIARVGRKEKDRGREKKSGFKFKYKARTSEQVKKRAEQRGGNFDSPVRGGIDMWRPKSGENVIRILPPTWDDFDHYGYDVFMHRFVGSDSSNYVCPNKMKGKACCICDEAKVLKADGEEEEAKKIAFQKRVWVWVIDRDDKNAQPQVWDMSWSQDRDISELSRFKSGKTLMIDHPDDGYDVIVKKTGSGKTNTKYHFNIERDASPIDDDPEKQEEILKFISDNPIPDVLKIFPNEHLEKKMEGTTAEKDEDLDEDEDAPKKKRRARDADEDEDEDDKPRKKKKPAEDEEEQDDPPRRRRPKDEEDDEDEDEDEDEKPRGKRKPAAEEDDEDEDEDRPRKKRKPPPDEEDEDEEDERPKKKKRPDPDEDEDEEDEKPRKKKRADPDEEDEDEDDRPRRRK